ncbi:MAG: hypothetical protein U0Q03_00210 [Acidimicrobiales bacterium]
MQSGAWLQDLRGQLPAHAAVIEALALTVSAVEALRWLEVGCSIGSGRADELSDIDAAIGFMDGTDIETVGQAVVSEVGAVVDSLVHALAGAPEPTRRFAVEFEVGIQLDLVLMPASWRTGLFDGTVAVVDKDGLLGHRAVSVHAGPPSQATAREWVMLGWWAVSDVAKFIHRNSPFEAAARIDNVRDMALRLHAAAHNTPFAEFGLTSILDFPPFELPARLADTYCLPDHPDSVRSAALAVVELLKASSQVASETLVVDLATPWQSIATARLNAAAGPR